jgi:hypothetical protein
LIRFIGIAPSASWPFTAPVDQLVLQYCNTRVQYDTTYLVSTQQPWHSEPTTRTAIFDFLRAGNSFSVPSPLLSPSAKMLILAASALAVMGHAKFANTKIPQLVCGDDQPENKIFGSVDLDGPPAVGAISAQIAFVRGIVATAVAFLRANERGSRRRWSLTLGASFPCVCDKLLPSCVVLRARTQVHGDYQRRGQLDNVQHVHRDREHDRHPLVHQLFPLGPYDPIRRERTGQLRPTRVVRRRRRRRRRHRRRCRSPSPPNTFANTCSIYDSTAWAGVTHVCVHLCADVVLCLAPFTRFCVPSGQTPNLSPPRAACTTPSTTTRTTWCSR